MKIMSFEEGFLHLTSSELMDQMLQYVARNSYLEADDFIKRNTACDEKTRYELWRKLRREYRSPETNPYIGKIAPKEYRPYQEPTPTKPVVKCPYCGSTDVKKISTTSRVVSVGVFGLASKKVGKQWHCNGCRADF